MFLSGLKYLRRLERQVKFAKNRCCKIKPVAVRIKFYSQNTNRLLTKSESTFQHLQHGIQEFHRKYILVPADKAENNVVIVWRFYYIHTLK